MNTTPQRETRHGQRRSPPGRQHRVPAKSATKPAPKLVTRKAEPPKSTAKTPIKPSVTNTPKPVKIHPTRAAQFAQTPTLLGLEPDHVARWLHERPIWVDELSGIGLLVAGLVLFLAQLNSSTANSLANSVAYTVRTLVGQGGALVLSVMIMVAGVAIILSRLGIAIRLTIRRAIFIEVAFVAFVALLHLLSRDSEVRALAREGRGGGYIGWAVSALIALPFGTALAIIVYSLIFCLAIGILIGVQRRHVRAVMTWIFARLNAAIGWLSRLTTRLPKPIDRPMAAPVARLSVDESVADYRYQSQADQVLNAPAPYAATIYPSVPNPDQPPAQWIPPPLPVMPPVIQAAVQAAPPVKPLKADRSQCGRRLKASLNRRSPNRA